MRHSIIVKIIDTYKKFQRLFLKNYANASYEMNIKSKYLLNILLILLIVIPVVLYFNSTVMGKTYLQLPIQIAIVEFIIVLGVIFILRRGYYRSAVIIIITTMTTGLMLSIALDDFYDSNLSYIHTLYSAFVIIFFHAFFGRKKYIIILPVVFSFFATIAFLITNRDLSPEESIIIKGFLVDFFFAMFLVYVIGYSMIKINNTIIHLLEKNNKALKRKIEEKASLEREMVKINEVVRQRIGHELHDDLGQCLIAIELRHNVYMRNLRLNGKVNFAELEKVSSLIYIAVQKNRNIAKGLGPVHLNAETLMSALNQLAVFIEDTHKISCQLDYNISTAVPDDLTAINLYHIIQEAVNNAIKHGKAKNIIIGMNKNENNLEICVRDDGIGYSDKRISTSGSGLKIMKHRAEMINASFAINRHKGGTTVTCLVS